MNAIERLLCLLIVSLFLQTTRSFYFEVRVGQEKCFNTTVFINERLLVEIDSPVLEPGTTALVKVYKGN